MTITGEQISDAAKRLVGIPFVHQGRDRNTGLDCGGVLTALFDEFEMPYTDNLEYNLVPSIVDPHVLKIIEQCGPLERVPFNGNYSFEDQLRPGYVLVLGYANRQLPQHCGVLTSTPGVGQGTSDLNGLSLVHSNTDVEECREDTIGIRWRSRVIAVFKFKGVEY